METSNGSTEHSYKLPNSLIDACVVYGLDEQPSEALQSRFSGSKVPVSKSRNLDANTHYAIGTM